ncbi:hypothetical protein [Belliella aquatica]|uniref:Uncharacterized protein n=1 Tax=Belliella aquatica TaxID=1323734 RepID=A0ABQ1M7J5_9BACT|nr:hypothetical protein [Belliella aquatica]MCH7405599.1 hypothetical protein [Belliella aquatica]GGC36276.1 hypothetical protein GCM10010993_13910 [Belliella aquatica]
MDISVNLKLEQIKELLSSLSPKQFEAVRKYVNEISHDESSSSFEKINLKQLLKNAPVISDQEIEKIQEARSLLALWRNE